MKRTTLYFTHARHIEVLEEELPVLGAGELLIETQLSAISAGTEMLVYRGEFPRHLEDEADTISGSLDFPMAFGYAAVGKVVEVGRTVDSKWQDRLVFAFQAHRSHLVATPETVVAVPDHIQPDDAVMFPNMETAVNLVHDAAPILGERVLVLGQGIVGLLGAALLHDFPLECLVTADRYEVRRQASRGIGVTASHDSSDAGFRELALRAAGGLQGGYDLVLELTGNPAALNDAIAVAGFGGRIIVGSWYGEKKAAIDLGGKYHRSRIQIVSSQVSTIAPNLSGRWTKTRRFQVAWNALSRIRPARWVTHRFPIEHSADAYQLLDGAPEQAIQVVLTYG